MAEECQTSQDGAITELVCTQRHFHSNNCQWVVTARFPDGRCLKKSAPETYKKANIFLFVADDLKHSDLGHYGNKDVLTPHIDTFAAESIEFSMMYTPTAMCAPSRAVLYTGLYPLRNGMYMNHGLFKNGTSAIYPGVANMGDVMRDRGYHFRLFGKDHVGLRKFRPKSGFDDMSQFQMHTGNITSSNQPQCLVFGSHHPHPPHSSTTYFRDMKDELILPPKWPVTKQSRVSLADYYSDVGLLDSEFGTFVTTIEDQSSFDANSFIIFTSDHGGGFFAKWSCYDDGLKVPFFVRHSAGLINPRRVKHITSFVDVLPTFVDISDAMPNESLDGSSLLSLITRANSGPVHDYVYGVHTNKGIINGNAYPIRSISDGKWKFILNINNNKQQMNVWLLTPWFRDWMYIPQGAGTNQEWAYRFVCRPKEELYNLEEDPHEMHNLAFNESYAAVAVPLKRALGQWFKQQGDERWKAEITVPEHLSHTTEVEPVSCGDYGVQTTTSTPPAKFEQNTTSCTSYNNLPTSEGMCRTTRFFVDNCRWKTTKKNPSGFCVDRVKNLGSINEDQVASKSKSSRGVTKTVVSVICAVIVVFVAALLLTWRLKNKRPTLTMKETFECYEPGADNALKNDLDWNNEVPCQLKPATRRQILDVKARLLRERRSSNSTHQADLPTPGGCDAVLFNRSRGASPPKEVFENVNGEQHLSSGQVGRKPKQRGLLPFDAAPMLDISVDGVDSPLQNYNFDEVVARFSEASASSSSSEEDDDQAGGTPVGWSTRSKKHPSAAAHGAQHEKEGILNMSGSSDSSCNSSIGEHWREQIVEAETGYSFDKLLGNGTLNGTLLGNSFITDV